MLDIDLINDFAKIMRDELINYGFSTQSIPNDIEEIMRVYCRVQKYRINSVKRSVLKAQNFDTLGEDDGLKILEGKIQNGDDLNLHLTSRIADCTKRDRLLDDWGIYHMHLGDRIDSNTGRINRTKNILFCRVDDSNVYFIKVAPHGTNTEEPWYDKELLYIIHKNWPESIEFAKIKDVESTELQIETKEDIKALRNTGLTTMMDMNDGTVYMPPGGGLGGDGTGPVDSIIIKRKIKDLKRAEEQIINKYCTIKSSAEILGYHFGCKPKFELYRYYYGYYVDILESNTMYHIHIESIYHNR